MIKANNFSKANITQELVDAVYDYVEARGDAEVMASLIKPVEKRLLENQFEFYAKRGNERITESGRLYLSDDEDGIKKFYLELDNRLKAVGIKPDYMIADRCPLLVAKREQLDKENILIKLAAQMLEVDDPEKLAHSILCQRQGLQKRQDFVEATIDLVMSI